MRLILIDQALRYVSVAGFRIGVPPVMNVARGVKVATSRVQAVQGLVGQRQAE
jgi:hypothetical protein